MAEISSFEGQQEGERILYVVRPHVIKRVVSALIALALGFILGYFVYFVRGIQVGFSNDSSFVTGIIAGLLVTLGYIWWSEISFDKERTFVTDRRIVRIQASFPIFEKRRAIFWNEAAKAKGYAPNIIFRICKIGTIKIQPTIYPLEDITIRWVYYFDDLSNYLDKVLFTYKNRPQEIETLKPFVTRPKGQRD